MRFSIFKTMGYKSRFRRTTTRLDKAPPAIVLAFLFSVNVFAMVHVKKDSRFGIFKIEKHPIASGDAKRKR